MEGFLYLATFGGERGGGKKLVSLNIYLLFVTREGGEGLSLSLFSHSVLNWPAKKKKKVTSFLGFISEKRKGKKREHGGFFAFVAIIVGSGGGA